MSSNKNNQIAVAYGVAESRHQTLRPDRPGYAEQIAQLNNFNKQESTTSNQNVPRSVRRHMNHLNECVDPRRPDYAEQIAKIAPLRTLSHK